MQSVMSKAYEHGGPGKFVFDPSSRLDENSIALEQKQRLIDEWHAHWDLSKPYLVEKSPINLVRTRFLQGVFPESYFIVVKRHPLAVSMATKKWSKTSIHELIEHWTLAYEMWEKDQGQIERHFSLKYEDLMTNPAEELGRLSRFLGTELQLPADIRIKSGINDRYFKTWNKALNLERRMSAKKIKNDFEARVASLGYELGVS